MLTPQASQTGRWPGVVSPGLGDPTLHSFPGGLIHMIICGKTSSFTIEATFILKQT